MVKKINTNSNYKPQYRRYRRKSNRNQYLRCKIDYVDTITWPTAEGDAPRFRSKRGNTRDVSINDILGSSEFQNYARIFSYYKLYGCSIIVTPSKQIPATNDTNYGIVVLSVFPALGNPVDFDTAKVSNSSVICSATDTVRKWINFQNSTGYIQTNTGLDGGLVQITSDYAATEATAQSWAFKITFYILLKNINK